MAGGRVGLHARRAELVGDERTGPWLRALRRAPAQVTNRRFREWDTLVGAHGAVGDSYPGDEAAGRFNRVRFGGCHGRQ